MDLHDLEHNTRDGVHIASLAGTWIALVAGLGGMRDHGETITFAPRLASGLHRLAFRMRIRGRRIRVEVDHDEATYTLMLGDVLEVVHHGEPITVRRGSPVTMAIPSAPARVPPDQPPGREPIRRHEVRR
jgi:alpha,alpha-trehalose phosphorylase